jgi:hypothetical protein
MARTIVVLADGATWMEMGQNTLILVVKDKEFEELADGNIEVPDLSPMVEMNIASIDWCDE